MTMMAIQRWLGTRIEFIANLMSVTRLALRRCLSPVVVVKRVGLRWTRGWQHPGGVGGVHHAEGRGQDPGQPRRTRHLTGKWGPSRTLARPGVDQFGGVGQALIFTGMLNFVVRTAA
jgi:hypothetical protein